MAGFHEHVADDEPVFDAHPPITLPLARNFTLPETLIVAVIVIALPFAAVVAPPVSEIVIVAPPPPPPPPAAEIVNV